MCQGDVIGCGLRWASLDARRGVAAFFTRNGALLGDARGTRLCAAMAADGVGADVADWTGAPRPRS